ncbi:MAG: molybdate ABC transporter substrate-binding protein [Pseudomonadota bacterium]
MAQRNTSLAKLALAGCLFLASPLWAGDVTIYAAASLTNVIKTLATSYEQDKSTHIKPSFASSSTLAKQIEAGAPAGLYIAADTQWMDYLQTRRLIDKGSRKNLLGNELVLIASAAQPRTVVMKKGTDLAASFTGKLCMGDPSHVPAGIYGQQALQSLGWWDALAKRVVGTEDVRTALAFVQRGECPLGVVYATDAAASTQVMIAGRFAASSHDPIIYPIALLPRASSEARDFYRYLQSDAAKAVYRQAGFVVLTP